jgi:hypothetical protein
MWNHVGNNKFAFGNGNRERASFVLERNNPTKDAIFVPDQIHFLSNRKGCLFLYFGSGNIRIRFSEQKSK